MKKSFLILLLAAMLPCVSLHAQKIELSPSVLSTINTLPDSVRQKAFNTAMEQELSAVNRDRTDITDYEDIIVVFIFFAAAVAITVVSIRSARRKQEDRNALISKMVDNGVFNNTNADSAEMIKALIPQKKVRTTKERIITYATLLGIGAGMLLFRVFTPFDKSGSGVNLISLAGFILSGYGLLALLATIITTQIEKKKAEEQQ